MENKNSPKDNSLLSKDFDDLDKFLDDLNISDKSKKTDNQEITRKKNIFVDRDGEEIAFLNPLKNSTISYHDLKSVSTELRAFLKDENIHAKDTATLQTVIAFPGDCLASSKENDEPEKGRNKITKNIITPGDNVTFTPGGDYIADQYGYVNIEGNTISIVSPLLVLGEMLSIVWFFSNSSMADIELPMIDFWLQKIDIDFEDYSKLNSCLTAANDNNLDNGCHTLITGQPPVDGVDGSIEWFVDIDKRIGQELSDGRIDFKDINLVVNVTENKLIAKLTPETRGIPGKNLKGRRLDATHGKPAQLVAGRSIQKLDKDGEAHYFATSDGALHYVGKKVYLSDILLLKDGVNFATGNIDFIGDVVIKGPISAGFSVQAGGDIVVVGTVEDGVSLLATGDIIITQGISGKRTTIEARRSLRTPYVNEATITAGDIIIGNYTFHARLRASGIVQVHNGEGEHAGSIMGGQVWAKDKIDAFIVGTKAWSPTELVVGILPEQTARLDQLQDGIEGKNAHMRQILDYFGISGVDLDKIRSLIQQAEGTAQKGMALRAKYLARSGKALQEFKAEKTDLLAQIGPASVNARIIIREQVFSNVTVSVGTKKRKITDERGTVTVAIDEGKLVLS